jgi:hypothetical protein
MPNFTRKKRETLRLRTVPSPRLDRQNHQIQFSTAKSLDSFLSSMKQSRHTSRETDSPSSGQEISLILMKPVFAQLRLYTEPAKTLQDFGHCYLNIAFNVRFQTHYLLIVFECIYTDCK